MNAGRFGLALGVVLFLMPALAAALVVSDGDSLKLGGERVRLWGIDAPELDQRCEHGGKVYACGEAARAALSSLIGSRRVDCEAVERDRYRRVVARCRAGGMDLGAAMVRLGWALDFKRYSGGHYAEEEKHARRARSGLWSGEFELPWEWRR